MNKMGRPEGRLRCTKDPFIEEAAPCRLKSIQFSTLSGEEIRKMGEAQVWRKGMYDANFNPIQDGLLDPRMGPPHKNAQCNTCHADFNKCPGHFGYLKLACPVFNVGFFSHILDILKCICKNCSRVLLRGKERLDFLRKMRNPRADALQKTAIMKQVRDRCKSTCCPWCGHANGVVKKGKNEPVVLHDLTKTSSASLGELHSALSHKTEAASSRPIYMLDPITVHSLFRRMLDEDCELLNLHDRPEKLLITEIAVPPLPIRPSVQRSGRTSNEDSITSILKEVINANDILRSRIENGQTPDHCYLAWSHLQSKLVQYINSEAPSVIADSRDRGFLQRLKGKQGRFRGNLSGKRVEYTGRTVISPDPNLKITEVAVPELMARILTFPERVSFHNIEKLRLRVRNGPTKYPGANFINVSDGSTKNLKFGDKRAAARELRYGDIVERHLEDGDAVLFNRQPSLHRMSIMCHRARVMPWRTLRFNESVCNPYNADFDGDEMNLHVPQTEEARTEALMLMGVQNNLCTPKNGEILVASTQDFLTTSFLITRKDTFYDRSNFSLICSYMFDAMEEVDLPTPTLIKPIELWTGKQLFSVLVRPNAATRVFVNLVAMEKNYTKGKESMCPNDGYVYFRNSELICGQLGKATLGNGNKVGLFPVLLRDYNSHAAATCMNRVAKLSARWIGNHGFSIGIDDVQPGEHLLQEKNKEIDEGYRKCDEFLTLYTKGQPGFNAPQTLESATTGVLNEIRDNAGKVCMKELHWRNSPLIMSQCGSKGSPTNISQMVVCVGQQSVGGRRAPDGFIGRTLPHFPLNSKSPAAKGFVANSFYSGLTATEFFFHTMGGREGLVDTAVKTAETGYMARQIMKGLEDIAVFYDQTVRNASGSIIQFLYGDDGLDPAKMEGKDGVPLNLDQLFMKVMATCPPRGQKALSSSEIFNIVDERLSKDDVSLEAGCSSAFKKQLLAHFNKWIELLKNTRRALKLDEKDGKEDACKEEKLKEEKIAANISGLTMKQLKVFLETCIHRYQLKRIEAGTSIGAIGAQSIAEPGTQMTLKTFHFAGVASMNVTLGVPRIKEIIYVTKKIKTPVITATLQSDRDQVSARMVKSSIQKTVLGEVAKAVNIVLNAARGNLVVKLDVEFIKAAHLEISAESVKMSILMHPKLKLKPEHVRVIDPSKLRIFPPELDKSMQLFQLHKLKSMLPNVIVKGISTIESAVVNESQDDKGMKFNLLARGTNLLAVMGVLGVDATKTNSNHLIETQNTLGIEAARKSIIKEIQTTMKSHGMSIDARHMMLLADNMTNRGMVLGMNRVGISKLRNSVLMLASFEKTGEHLFNASYSGREDRIEGVSECVIMGVPMKLGTGILKVKQRLDSLPQLKYQPDPILR